MSRERLPDHWKHQFIRTVEAHAWIFLLEFNCSEVKCCSMKSPGVPSLHKHSVANSTTLPTRCFLDVSCILHPPCTLLYQVFVCLNNISASWTCLALAHRALPERVLCERPATTFLDRRGLMVPRCPRGWSPLREHDWQIRIPTIGQKSTVRIPWEIEVPSQQYRNRSTGTDYRLLFSIQFTSALH
jgi:hypothetical protein